MRCAQGRRGEPGAQLRRLGAHVALGISRVQAVQQGQGRCRVVQRAGAQGGRVQQGVVRQSTAGKFFRQGQIQVAGLAVFGVQVRAAGQGFLALCRAEQCAGGGGPGFAAQVDAQKIIAQLFPRLPPAGARFVGPEPGHARFACRIARQKFLCRPGLEPRRGLGQGGSAFVAVGSCRWLLRRCGAGVLDGQSRGSLHCGRRRRFGGFVRGGRGRVGGSGRRILRICHITGGGFAVRGGHLTGFRGGAAIGGSLQGLFQGQGLGQHIPARVLAFEPGKQPQRARVVLKPGRAEPGRAEQGVVGQAAVCVAVGHGGVDRYGLFGVAAGKGAAGQVFQAFRRAEQGGGPVGPVRISFVNILKFRRQFFPGFAQIDAAAVLEQGLDVGLGRVVALGRGRQGGVAGIVKADHQQAEGQQKDQGRQQPREDGLVGRLLRAPDVFCLTGHSASFAGGACQRGDRTGLPPQTLHKLCHKPPHLQRPSRPCPEDGFERGQEGRSGVLPAPAISSLQ